MLFLLNTTTKVLLVLVFIINVSITVEPQLFELMQTKMILDNRNLKIIRLPQLNLDVQLILILFYLITMTQSVKIQIRIIFCTNYTISNFINKWKLKLLFVSIYPWTSLSHRNNFFVSGTDIFNLDNQYYLIHSYRESW